MAPWPEAAEVGRHDGADTSVLAAAAEVLGLVRREKTAHKRSMRARVARLTVTGPPALLAAVEAARGDIVTRAGWTSWWRSVGDALVVEVELADEA